MTHYNGFYRFTYSGVNYVVPYTMNDSGYWIYRFCDGLLHTIPMVKPVNNTTQVNNTKSINNTTQVNNIKDECFMQTMCNNYILFKSKSSCELSNKNMTLIFKFDNNHTFGYLYDKKYNGQFKFVDILENDLDVDYFLFPDKDNIIS